jgi:hypothetical protein
MDPQHIRIIAARAGVDPRIARIILLGPEERRRKCRSTTRVRVEQAQRELGLESSAPSVEEVER